MSRGLRILERNISCRYGEIDLVAADRQGGLAFVEVKTRSPSTRARPGRSVTRAKQARLIRAAQLYLQRHPDLARRPCRFDVVEVYLDRHGQVAHVEWVPSAFHYR